ncbi:MAG: hypothetical protein H7333_11880 [Bdellovibrionales bacterium]|nr:hypothetical protein [Oligoflexia bacterium]
MKLLCLALIAFSRLAAQAQTSTAPVMLNAHSATQTIRLVDQRFEPIYESQPYETTCSRQVIDHTESVCETVSDSVCSGGAEVCETVNDSVCNSGGCTDVPRRACHTTPTSCVDVPRRVCRDQNVFRTDYYSCIQYHDVVVGRRLVKTFNHQIEVTVANAALLAQSTLSLQVKASENSISARLLNSYSSGLLNYQVSTLQESDSGSIANRSERLVIDLALSAATLQKMASATLDGLELGRNALRFQLKNANEISEHLDVSIRLVRNRALFGNSVRYDGTKSIAELGLVGQGNNIQALIPFQKLGVDSLGNLKHDLSVSIRLNPGTAPLLNATDFQALLDRQLSQTLSKVKPSF